MKQACLKEVKEKSSHYGLNILGYTCAIKVKTIGCEFLKMNKSKKITLVRIKN